MICICMLLAACCMQRVSVALRCNFTSSLSSHLISTNCKRSTKCYRSSCICTSSLLQATSHLHEIFTETFVEVLPALQLEYALRDCHAFISQLTFLNLTNVFAYTFSKSCKNCLLWQ